MGQRDALQKELLRVTHLIGSIRGELLRMIQRGLNRDNPDVVTQTQRYHDLLDEQKGSGHR